MAIGMSSNVTAQTPSIPSWIKKTALLWGQGQLSDDEFINALQWLLDQKIISIHSTISTQTTPPTSTDHNQADYRYQARMAQIPPDRQTTNVSLSAKLPTESDVASYGYQLRGTPANSDIFDQNGASDSIQQTYVKTSISPQSRLVISMGTYADDLTALKEHDAIDSTLIKNGYQSTVSSSYAFDSLSGKVFCYSHGLSAAQGSGIMYDFCVSGNILYLFEFDVNYNADHNSSNDLVGIESDFFQVDKKFILG